MRVNEGEHIGGQYRPAAVVFAQRAGESLQGRQKAQIFGALAGKAFFAEIVRTKCAEHIMPRRCFAVVVVIRRLLPVCPRAKRLANKQQSSEAFAESWLRSLRSRVITG